MDSAKSELEPLLSEEEKKIKQLEERLDDMRLNGGPPHEMENLEKHIYKQYERLFQICSEAIPYLSRNWRNREVDEPFLREKVAYYERKMQLMS